MTPPVSGAGGGDKHAEKSQEAAAVVHPSDPISQSIGEFGRWQFLLTFLLSLVNFPCTFHIFAPTFEGAQRDFWCARPDGLSMPVDQWKNVSGIFDLDKVKYG
ncbi:hypothetical protein LSTR_LSTR017661 [Laodelphax striatellus]|uniref:Uncharacterized protein n=1 Tax=Laodelphax striatellus TaxID=195883 RepID=A0A482WMA3_LAOST|nr:hypothetical protein LSTR_LSTR017661 [Laodelphax striatellus]